MGSTPAAPAIPTAPDAVIDTPPSELAGLYRRKGAVADGKKVIGQHPRISPPSRRRRKVAKASLDWKSFRPEKPDAPMSAEALKAKNEKRIDLEARKELYSLLEAQYKKSKTGFFRMLAAMDRTVEYALPEIWHECDPFELLDLFDSIDWHRFALAMGYSELEIRRYGGKRVAA